ncbi:MAG: ribonuclease [Alphaproteobacteria bacterium]|nr:MAG: ribonuclease [Alphaproteobacteria bacterium]
MAEWLYEEGIGENRAILVEGGEIVEAAIELPGLRAGAVVPARLSSAAGSATLEDGTEAMVSPVGRLSEGAAFRAEVLRETIPERGRPKPPKVRPTELAFRAGPSLADRVGSPALPAHRLDLFEQAGWSELLEQARTGEIAFPGGALRMSVTPAMTLFDVDGSLPAEELAEVGAEAAAKAIRRLGITGSIGIDLPTLPRERRQRAAAAVDGILPQPFERTAVNGFGFLQIVRRRERPSIPELVQGDPVAATARALLRRAGRETGAVALNATPRLVAFLEERPDWLKALARRTGGEIVLRAQPGLAISAGHVQTVQS